MIAFPLNKSDHSMIRRALHLLPAFFALLLPPATGGAEEFSRGALIGQIEHYTVRGDETLYDIARARGLGFDELERANPGVDPWIPDPGTVLALPTLYLLPPLPQEGVLINVAELRMYYFPSSGRVLTYPVSAGMECCGTPLGTSKVVNKRVDPTWYPPESIREEKPDLPKVVPPGPDNPLGKYAMYLAWKGIIIHGTNTPWSIGRLASHGCVRMYPENIEELYPLVPVGTKIHIIDEPVKLGWFNGELYMEVHQPLPPKTTVRKRQAAGEMNQTEKLLALYGRIQEFAGKELERLDWDAIGNAIDRNDGIPTRITK